jgi:hypothetical protein
MENDSGWEERPVARTPDRQALCAPPARFRALTLNQRVVPSRPAPSPCSSAGHPVLARMCQFATRCVSTFASSTQKEASRPPSDEPLLGDAKSSVFPSVIRCEIRQFLRSLRIENPIKQGVSLAWAVLTRWGSLVGAQQRPFNLVWPANARESADLSARRGTAGDDGRTPPTRIETG